MWATTKYVSVTWKSIGADASMTPDRPPMRNVTMKPMANFIALGNTMLPPHMVPIQLKNFTPVGTAMSIDRPEKYASVTAPVANMWWAQTPTDSDAMASVASTSPP